MICRQKPGRSLCLAHCLHKILDGLLCLHARSQTKDDDSGGSGDAGKNSEYSGNTFDTNHPKSHKSRSQRQDNHHLGHTVLVSFLEGGSITAQFSAFGVGSRRPGSLTL